MSKNNNLYSFVPPNSGKKSSIYGSNSTISTNKDTCYNNSINSKRLSHYSSFGTYKRDERFSSKYNNANSLLNRIEETIKSDTIIGIKLENIKKNIKRKKIKRNTHNTFKTKRKINNVTKENNIHHEYITQFNISKTNNNYNLKENKKAEILLKNLYPFNKYYCSNSYISQNNDLCFGDNSLIKKKKKNILSLNFENSNINNNNKYKFKRNLSNYHYKSERKNKLINKENKNNKRNENVLELNNKKMLNTDKNIKNKLINKIIFNSNISNKIKPQKNEEQKKADIDFETEKNKLKSIKKQYIYTTYKALDKIYFIKNNMNKINLYQNNIIDLNNKCAKYSDLIKQDNLQKYREENKKNLIKYKSLENITNDKAKLKAKNKKAISSRPQSYNINKNKIVRKDKKNMKKMNSKKKNENKSRCISAEIIKRKEIKKERENKINNRVIYVLKNDYENNKIGNKLDYCNYLLKENEEKKQKFYNQLEDKSKQIENNKKRNNSCPYKYGMDINKGYNNNNIDKNLHLKYIYRPESEINQNLIYQRINDKSDKNYYIKSFSYKRKNKLFI